ncbi:IS3 family transposase [Formosa sp. L2A11]|uniref:IS3 family transposase n=1 Tax=Formosa sp. L2A11 TaxID=2686363 RepID=UPI00131D8F00
MGSTTGTFKKKVWDVRSKKDLVNAIYSKHKISKTNIINMVGMVHSSYYRTPSFGKKGNTPSKLTYHKSRGWVNQDAVIASIKEILSHEFIDCGYRLMTSYLKKEAYVINHKKLYRIMKEQGMLKLENRINRSGSGRKFVKFRKVNTSRPMECLEMDIKTVWVPSVGKNAYLLSIIDVHTRRILKDYFSIKQDKVIAFLSELFAEYQYPNNVVIRSDNGSQFIANNVREYLGLIGVQQEFTHIATPEENAHIEAYHGILKKEIFQKVDYRYFGQIEQILKRYVTFYNNTRLHGLLGRITPMEKWDADKHLILMKKLTA